MGAVYKARHIYLNKIRAVKIVHGALAIETEYSDRFIREARILSELNHPNLVRLYEFGTLDSGNFFMVMEFVHGENLLARIRRKGRLSIEEAVRICRDAGAGLHSAHQLGIVHRDVSPDNILVVRDSLGEEIVKVIDFGIAKAIAESHKFTATHMFIGKPEYCSPEQTGFLENTSVDHRSDIYSLAVNFYHLISGKLPFSSSTPQGFLLKHATEPPLPILAHFKDGEVPELLDQVLRKALAKYPSERYQSMLEFTEELSRIESSAIKLEHTTAIQHPMQTSREFFDLGKKSFDQLEWTEAIRWWNKAHALSPDPALQGWIAAAEERLQLERKVSTVLTSELEECEVELYQGNSTRASQLLEHVERSLSPELNLGYLQTRVSTLRQRLSEPAPKSVPSPSRLSGVVVWTAVISFFLLIVGGAVVFYLVPHLGAGRKKAEQQALKEQVRSLIDENRFREARKKLLLLEEKGIDPDDPKFGELETLLREREQNRGKSLYLEAEAAFNSSNIELANGKLKDLENLNVPSFETQIASLKERIRQYSEYNSVSEKTRTPLMQEIVQGNTGRARELIQHGAEINAADGNGYTVLMYVIWKTPDLVMDLLIRGANVNALDNRNVTALHVACDIGHLQSVNTLLEFGAKLDFQNQYGATPLIVAATRGHTDIARLLIDEGANLTLKTPNGYDALKTAEYYNHHEIAAMIRQRLARSTEPFPTGKFEITTRN